MKQLLEKSNLALCIQDITNNEALRDSASDIILNEIYPDLFGTEFDPLSDERCDFIAGCVMNDRLVGVMGCRAGTSEDWLIVERLAVLRQYRRHGIGSALLARASELARSTDKDSIVLTSTRSAERFYRGLGFTTLNPLRPLELTLLME